MTRTAVSLRETEPGTPAAYCEHGHARPGGTAGETVTTRSIAAVFAVSCLLVTFLVYLLAGWTTFVLTLGVDAALAMAGWFVLMAREANTYRDGTRHLSGCWQCRHPGSMDAALLNNQGAAPGSAAEAAAAMLRCVVRVETGRGVARTAEGTAIGFDRESGRIHVEYVLDGQTRRHWFPSLDVAPAPAPTATKTGSRA